MTTLILALAAPRFSPLGRFAKACGQLFDAFAEAQAMARVAQQRYPFAVE